MSTTNVNIGFGEATRNSSKVLKPPGGGTSDIFGGTLETVEQSPRRVRTTNHLQSSSLFVTNGTTEPPSTPRNKTGNDSHMRLFGPVENRPQTATKNRMKSNIPFGVNSKANCNASSESATPSSVVTVQNGQEEVLATPKARRNPVTGDGVCSSDSNLRRSIRKRDGNPVTGEGYTAVVNGEKEASSPPASATTTTNGNGTAEIRRNRVPPGGYSSGLW